MCGGCGCGPCNSCCCGPCPYPYGLPACCDRPCCSTPGLSICCRAPWNISQPCNQWLDFCLAPLACRDQKYECWLSQVGPKVDTNLCASLYSSHMENNGCNLVSILPPKCLCGSRPSRCPRHC